MAIAKKKLKAEVSRLKKEENILEKIIISLFLIFVIIATIILFRAPAPSSSVPITSKALSAVQLDKTAYNLSERIQGIMTLQIEPRDVLPRETKFSVFVSTNVPDCQLKYICPNGIPMAWHNYTNGQCVEIDPDPESSCCFFMGPACGQVILNSKFKAPLGGLTSWFAFPYGTNPSSIFIEDLTDPITYNVTMEKALVLDTTDITYSGIPNVSSSAQQILSNRQFSIKDLVPANERAVITGQDVVPCYSAQPPGETGYSYQSPAACTNIVSYIATMYVYDQEQSAATFVWANSNSTVATLALSIGKTVSLNIHNPGWTTLNVTATAEGKTAVAYFPICVYRSNPNLECFLSEVIPAYQSSQETSKPELSFDSGNSEIKNDFGFGGNKNSNTLYLQGGQGQIPGKQGEIKWKLAYTPITPIMTSDGCAFEVIVKGKTPSDTPRNLHYWYQVRPNCGPKFPSVSDKYIDMPLPAAMNTVANYTRNLYLNWTNSFGGAGSQNDIITEIQLVAHGYWDTVMIHGQRAYFDNVELWKVSSSQSSSCTGQNRVCCVEGSGLGTYLGDQFNCTNAGEKCYERCAPSIVPRNFEQFKALSSTPSKFNTTLDKCRAVVSGVEIDLRDYCYPGHAGDGYTACIDMGNASSTPTKCRGWDNIYIVNLNNSAFSAFKIAQNGTYSLTLRILYNHFETPENCSEQCLNYGKESCRDYCVISEVTAPFIVGTVGGGAPTCPDTDYNCYNAPVISETNWTECLGNTQTKTRTLNCTYIGTAVCPRYKAIIQTLSQNCTAAIPCYETDYSCDEWQPAPCRPMATQTRTCTLVSQTCDVNNPSSVEPAEQRTCDISAITEYVQVKYTEGMTRAQMKQQLEQFGWSNEEITSILNQVYGYEEKPSLGWLLYLVIGLVIVAVVVVVIIFVIVPSAKKGAGVKAKAEAYPELTSYIKDAQTTGATKQEITAKLQEAGWPKDAIEASFKATQA